MRQVPLTAVILAAGQGRRLEPITLSHSKAMTPIMGKPITAVIIEKLQALGFSRFVLVIGKDDDLRALASELRGKGISIEVALQEEQLGTAHALAQAKEHIREDFLLASCDNLYPEASIREMTETFVRHRPPAVLALFEIGPGDLDRCAGVRLDGEKVLEIVEKPGQGSGPWDAVCKFFFIFNRGILEHLEGLSLSRRGEYEVQEALQRFLATQSQPARRVFVHDFLHLTTAEDLIAIHRHNFSNHGPFSIHQEARVEQGVTMIQPVVVDQGAYIQAGARLGPYAYVGKGAKVLAGASVEESVIYANAVVSAGARVKKQVVLHTYSFPNKVSS
jgi:NDP-sugar pyrophosphorylase family protein